MRLLSDELDHNILYTWYTKENTAEKYHATFQFFHNWAAFHHSVLVGVEA